MLRTGVFIGVDQTGGLQKLTDAARGAAKMHQWALSQGMADRTEAKLITDADGARVTPDMIYDEIKAIIDGAGADQLILYFAGHGVNINRGEHWLLTEAPGKASAAVNVSGSVELARYCGIQHIVVISDACRVAPEGLQAQNVRGVDVFPNDGGGDRSKPVDQFFACLLGRTATELKDPAVAAGNFSALYTTTLLDALTGNHADLLEPGDVANDAARYVRPRSLQSHLEMEVPRRVKALKLEHKVNQNPDAIITSDKAWLARLDVPPRPPIPVEHTGPRDSPKRGRRTSNGNPTIARVRPPRPTLRGVTDELIRSAVDGDQAAVAGLLWQAKAGDVAGAEAFAGRAERIATPFGPDHFETQCGIKVRGKRIVEVFAPRAHGADIGGAGDVVRVNIPENPAISVLMCFEGDVGAVIPVFPGFIAALSFEDGDLVDVAYEPSANTWRWGMYRDRAADVRALRAIAASSSQDGRFRLQQEDAFAVAQRMQYAKGIDPTLAVYAAYAYYDLQSIERIREMSGYLRKDLGATFFDLELLSRMVRGKRIAPDDNVVPFVPLLSQGWALLQANRVKMNPELDGIERTVRDSLWSLFDAQGIDLLRRAMATGAVR